MACEKCWSDAFLRTLGDPSKTQEDHYSDLLAERKDNPCTPEQERGRTASEYGNDEIRWPDGLQHY